MKYLQIPVVLMLLCAAKPYNNPEKPAENMESLPEFTLTILYDNYLFDTNFSNSWGFSCLVEGAGKTILFDTGGKDGNLMRNFKAAGKDPELVDLVVISHIHWDHTGGLEEFLAFRTGIEVFVPASFPETFKEDLRELGARVESVSGPRDIADHVRSSGEMGDQIVEQSLVLEAQGGLIILTGCAHPGIEEIVDRVRKDTGEEILLLMGGFHLLRTSREEVQNIAQKFKALKVKYAAPTHCSGDATREIFREIFGDHYLRAGAGRVIHTGDL